MDIVVHDHCGHAFQIELSRELARRGHEVVHLHCATFASAKGALEARREDPASLEIRALRHRRRFAKYSYGKRLVQEVEYGVTASRAIGMLRPDVVVSDNTPLLTQWVMNERLAALGIPLVGWVQDLYSDAISAAVGSGLIGRAIGRAAALVEGRTLRRCERVIAISDRFGPRLAEWGIDASRIRVIPNWAPLGEFPIVAADNPWAHSHDLAGKFVVAYTGILGLKHDADLLFELAQFFRSSPDVVVLVVAEGPGAERLARSAPELGNLVVLPFEAADTYPEVLAAADVLVAILTPAAGNYSVPSKVLSYLCASRPIVGILPLDNDAATIIRDARAGLTFDPHSTASAFEAIDALRADAARRTTMGRAGRAYAEAEFQIGPIADKFEDVLRGAASREVGSRQPRRARSAGSCL